MLFAWELQRRTGGRVVSVALHPGEVMTEVVRSLPGPMRWAYRLLLQTILLTPAQGWWWCGEGLADRPSHVDGLWWPPGWEVNGCSPSDTPGSAGKDD